MRFKTVLQLFLIIALATQGGAQETVKIGTLEWEPYIGPNMRNNGYVVEIVEEAFNRVGYKVHISFFPWARALKLAENGDLDGLCPEYYSEERNKKFAFSDPFPGGPLGLYKRKDSPATYTTHPQINQTDALRGLQEYTFGVVRGYINTAEFDAASFLKKEEVMSDKLNLKKLYNRRVDFIVIDKHVAEHLITHSFPTYRDELEFMPPPMQIKQLYIAFSKRAKNYQKKLKAFNSGLQQIKQDGTMTRIMTQHGFNEAEQKTSK